MATWLLNKWDCEVVLLNRGAIEIIRGLKSDRVWESDNLGITKSWTTLMNPTLEFMFFLRSLPSSTARVSGRMDPWVCMCVCVCVCVCVCTGFLTSVTKYLWKVTWGKRGLFQLTLQGFTPSWLAKSIDKSCHDRRLWTREVAGAQSGSREREKG